MRQLDRPDLRGFVPRQKPSEFRLVLKLTRPENHSLERRKAFLPGGWIFLSTRGRILISANVQNRVDPGHEQGAFILIGGIQVENVAALEGDGLAEPLMAAAVGQRQKHNEAAPQVGHGAGAQADLAWANWALIWRTDWASTKSLRPTSTRTS